MCYRLKARLSEYIKNPVLDILNSQLQYVLCPNLGIYVWEMYKPNTKHYLSALDMFLPCVFLNLAWKHIIFDKRSPLHT